MKNAVLKRAAAVALAAAMVFTVAPAVTAPAVSAQAATKKTVKLSKKSLNIKEKKGYKLSIKNTAKKAKISWSSSDKKVVTVKASKNKKSATVTPVAATGSAIVTAKVGKKKYNCKVTVKIAENTQAANRFDDVKAAIEANGVAETVTGAGIQAKVLATPDKQVSVTTQTLGAIPLDGSLIAAEPVDQADTLLFGVTGTGNTLLTGNVTGNAYFTLNKDKKINYVYIDVKDAAGADLVKVTSKKDASIDATQFTKTEVPANLADAVELSGTYASMITDKSKIASGLLQILEKLDADLNTKYGFGVNAIGFDNYK